MNPALRQPNWSDNGEAGLGHSFTIEGEYRQITVDGNKIASLLEISMQDAQDIPGVAWHEAWHSTDQLFLTPSEKKLLRDTLTPDIEKQADVFARYAKNQKTPIANSAKPLFQRILNFFHRLRGYVAGHGFTSA